MVSGSVTTTTTAPSRPLYKPIPGFNDLISSHPGFTIDLGRLRIAAVPHNSPARSMPVVRTERVPPNPLFRDFPMYKNQPSPQENGGHRGRSTRNRKEFQFWQQAMAMGSLVGNKFIQMLGAECEVGEDASRRYPNGELTGDGISHVAFDFTMEVIVIRAKLKLDARALPPALRPIEAEISFDDICSRGISIVEQKSTVPIAKQQAWMVTVTVNCKRPPRFFTEFEGADQIFNRGQGFIPRRRATAMDFAITGVTEVQAGPIQSVPEGPCGYPTFWNTYRWVFHLNLSELRRLKACAAKLRLLAEEDGQIDILALQRPRWREENLHQQDNKHLFVKPDLSKIRFGTRVLIEGLIGLGTLKPGEVPELLRALEQHARVPAFQERLLESLFGEERIRSVQAIVAGKARYLRAIPPPQLAHLVMIRSVMVTPTRVLVGPPQQEPSNTVTRKYAKSLDGIVRVSFTDEEDRLFANDQTKQHDSIRPDVGIMARVRRALQHGIVIGGQTFLPVASSPSQQKDRSIWFINHRIIDGQALRAWMGNVAETIVAKHAARMGLPFSTSRSVKIDLHLGPMQPDIERNGYCFTDGVGFAGRAVLAEAARALGHHKGINSQPSAIQFRMGGAKGMLASWPKLVGEHEVRLRPSLVKFESALTELNVVRIAKYQGAFLNRQFINIMCANGIPEDLFIEIFRSTVDKIKGLADRVRDHTWSEEDIKLISTCSEFPLVQVIKAGFHKNPLILDMVDIVECQKLQDLKWRARLPIPFGVFLIGIADESGTLEEGEVFCQYQEDDSSKPRVVVSEVLVCRAPALHPGDVRRAFAVDRPELRHLRNVIVFSTKGARDLPNMLGGGDLDGDDFTIIWDPRFVQPLRPYEPMNYTAPPPIREDHVTQAHLNENFVQYILNDVLGFVDNAHLAWSDYYKEGPFHADCLALSEIHSTAVDFAKTGQAATYDSRLKPREWPSFMDNDNKKKTYESQKILGKLFELVRPDPHFRPRDIKALDYPVDDFVVKHPVYGSLLEALRPIKADYEQRMHYDMRRYRVFEPEIPASIALRNRRRKRAKQTELTEPLRDSYTVHVRGARDAALRAVEGVNFKTSLTKEQVVARHCYALTFEREYVQEWEKQQHEGLWGYQADHDHDHDQDEEGHELRQIPMTSFAWIFLPELVQLAGLRTNTT